MQQRVGLARAFATDAPILLMDEPFSALDPLIRNKLQDELLALQARVRKTILFVTHDLDEALKLGNQTTVLEGGRIVQTGTPEDIVLRPANAYVGEFVQHMNPLSVLNGRMVMRPWTELAADGAQRWLDPGPTVQRGARRPGPSRRRRVRRSGARHAHLADRGRGPHRRRRRHAAATAHPVVPLRQPVLLAEGGVVQGVCGPTDVIRALATSDARARACQLIDSARNGDFHANPPPADPAVRTPGSIAGAVAAALAVGAPLPAAAQQAGASSGIEEIVVTAQRREENLQDVGIAVTALGGETLTNLNITMATDITRAVPSLKMNAYSSSQVVFNIRGVSQNDYGDQQEPPVAVYQDDSYASSINLASFPVFDLARVEVLRGPQGTLFGRNATGGAIQFVSRTGRPRSSRATRRPPSAATASSSSKARCPGRSPTPSRRASPPSATPTTATWNR